jgi:hypothetical protein
MRCAMSICWLVLAGALAVTAPAEAATTSSSDLVLSLVRADTRAPSTCRRGLHAGVAAVACEVSASSRLRLSPHGGRAVRVRRGAAALRGAPLAPGTRLDLRSDRAVRDAQLSVVAQRAGALTYARFRLGRVRRLRAQLVVPRRSGDPRLSIGGRPRAAATIRHVPAAPAPPPVLTPPPAVTPPPPPVAPVPPAATPTPSPVTGPAATRECGDEAPADAGDAASFDRLWHDDRNGPGWTGGDATISVALGDGRIAWLFGDTFIGGVRPDGSRGDGWRMVRNSVVVQDGACLTTYTGGTAAAPDSLMAPADPDAWWWPASARLSADGIEVVLQRVVRTGPGAWDFAVVGQDVAVLDPRTLATTAVAPLPGDGSILWGAALLDEDGAIDVYGVENDPNGGRLYLARTAGPSLRDAWRFYRGGEDPWSADAGDALPLAGADALPVTVGVVHDEGGYALVSQAPVFGTSVLMRRADAPEGPFGPAQVIASAPAPPDDPTAYTYGAHLHPELAAGGLQLLSYNVNGPDALTDASLYRPRFLSLAWPP